jgi:hypothetical protein
MTAKQMGSKGGKARWRGVSYAARKAAASKAAKARWAQKAKIWNDYKMNSPETCEVVRYGSKPISGKGRDRVWPRCGNPAKYIWTPRNNPTERMVVCYACGLDLAGNYKEEELKPYVWAWNILGAALPAKRRVEINIYRNHEFRHRQKLVAAGNRLEQSQRNWIWNKLTIHYAKTTL